MAYCAEELAWMEQVARKREAYEAFPRQCGVCEIYIFNSDAQAKYHNGRYVPHINHNHNGLCGGCRSGNKVYGVGDLTRKGVVMELM